MEAFLKAEQEDQCPLYITTAGKQTIKRSKKRVLSRPNIIIISVDAVKGAFEAMIAEQAKRERRMQSARAAAMDTVKDVVAGKQVPKRIVTKGEYSRLKSPLRNSRAAKALRTKHFLS
jgi:simple sugar transport system substrate-binding protein